MEILMKTEEDVLNDILEKGQDADYAPPSKNAASMPSCTDDCCYEGESATQKSNFDFYQWQIGTNDTFRPAGKTRQSIPPGVYSFDRDESGLYVKKIKVITDSLIELPDSTNEKVLKGVQKFWSMEERYRKHGLLYKRGILLWGPPGSGKTATIALLNNDLLKQGGIVVMMDHPKITSMGLEALRRIEPDRKIICIMEDIDEIIEKYGEHDLLASLDGENQVENICNIATTNYPERLGARIINRPSRFDERIFVGMPSKEARLSYLRHILGEFDELTTWVSDSEGLSIAHLRELAAAVRCLDQDYSIVLERLKRMKHKVKAEDMGMDSSLGFGR